MQGRLEGKVIVVASAGGIGTGLARRYAAEGASVIIGDVDTEGAYAAAEAARADGGTAVGVALDGSSEEAIRAAVERAQTEFGGLDGFHVNYAAFSDLDGENDVLSIPMDELDKIFRMNQRGYVLCTRLAVPAMIARGGGCILYTSSAASFEPQTVRVGYAMNKVAVHALMRHVAFTFGPQGIRANALTPGVTTHPRFEQSVPQDWAETIAERTPRRRLGQPSDIAAMSSFLMSDDANFVTGQLISVDGGRTMRQ